MTVRHSRDVDADGVGVVTKTWAGAPPGFFAAEARGLDLLRVSGGPPIPRVRALGDEAISVEWVETAAPTAAAAEEFGRRLATMHAASLGAFGADVDGFIGPLPLPNTRYDDWPAFYAATRIMPYLSGLSREQRALVMKVCEHIADIAGPSEPPARIHGDLWSGNLVWGADGNVWLIDAAGAHGGHRETDLAMLSLFGAPHLDRIVAAYDEKAPLAAGWRQRVALHQLHPLLVHAELFGGGYVERVTAAAKAALA